MASSSAGRILQTVKKHVPSIRFPNRIGQKIEPGPGSSVKTPEVSSTLSAISKKALPTETVARTTVAAFPSTVSNAGGVHIYDNLPARYRRRPLTDEEIEYIENGGPL
ncbi:alpha-ketoglutarate dehydrogenase component 4-like [Montipora foliosa]|uniref:alpha-ketoglutarate dehydrogenase component 4-like n=1 Tax=Montipora foliosa TaxID=591990 RepID=UPI0035F1D158